MNLHLLLLVYMEQLVQTHVFQTHVCVRSGEGREGQVRRRIGVVETNRWADERGKRVLMEAYVL